MNQGTDEFSTQKITPELVSRIIDALKNKQYGSVEIYIQNYTVTQITERTITKVIRTVTKKVPIFKAQVSAQIRHRQAE